MTRIDGAPTESSKSSDELRAELDQTRERMSTDVQALTNKLSPENLKAEAKHAALRSFEKGKERVMDTLHRRTEQVRETMENTENTIFGYARENPIPLSLIGLGVGLLVWNARRKADGDARRPDPSVVGRSEVYEGLDADDGERLASDGTSRHLAHLQDRVRSGVSSVKHAAADTAHQVRDKLGHLESEASDQARRAKAAAERVWEEQPLVLGAVALGVGLVVGLSIPSTESESQLVGEYRDKLLGSVKERARQLGDQAERALHDAGSSLTSDLAERDEAAV
jgi:ElaB/YqjD/DUF883 family membrane-anchored ribosome-binding protein